MEQTLEDPQKIACFALHLAGQSGKSFFKNIMNKAEIDFIQTGYTLFGHKFNELVKEAGESLKMHDFQNINVITVIDKKYPALLKKSISPPLALFYIGDINLLSTPLISIVGTRNPSFFTARLLGSICEFLSGKGYTLVSGLAIGIDSIVHAHSFTSGTIGVSPQSLDLKSPKINEYLFEHAIRGNQRVLILGEYPATTHVRKYHYVHRNRIIAAISEHLVFAEGGLDSGAMITANWRMKNNQKLFVIHSPFQKNNAGALRLLNSNQAENIAEYFPVEIYDKSFEEADKLFLEKKPFYLGNGLWMVIHEMNFSVKFLSPG
jgi:DNA processing protein